MPKAFSSWTVLPHDPIVECNEHLWLVTGDLPNMPLRRNMVIARREDGSLVVHNPIALEAEAMDRIDRWGPVREILVPNGWHRLDAPNFRARYPEARVYAPAGSRARVEQVVAVDGTYDDVPRCAHVWTEGVDGIKAAEGVLAVTAPEGLSLVFNDLVFNQPHLPGIQGWFVRMMGSSGGPRITRVARLTLVKDRAAVRASLQGLAGLPGLIRVIPGHGEPIEQDAPGVLRQVAAGL